jgi:hypothetical protein
MVYKDAKVTLNRLQKYTTLALRHVIWLLSNQRLGVYPANVLKFFDHYENDSTFCGYRAADGGRPRKRPNFPLM